MGWEDSGSVAAGLGWEAVATATETVATATEEEGSGLAVAGLGWESSGSAAVATATEAVVTRRRQWRQSSWRCRPRPPSSGKLWS